MALWTIDPVHSEIRFKVKHLVISTVTGQFKTFKGSVTSHAADFSDARVVFEADVNSISTNNEQRDGHLKSADFFDAANHPTISFISSSIAKKTDGTYALTGDLTIRGTKRRITLGLVYGGTVKGFEGDVAGFEITGKLNRQDYGLRWNALTETGGVVVSDEIGLDMMIELKKVQAEVAVAA